MNTKDKQFQDKLVELFNTEAGCLLPVSFLPHVVNTDGVLKLVGHYLCFRKGARMTFEPANRNHYLGVHECLCLTVRRPSSDNDLLNHAQCLPTIRPFGQTVWLGQVLVTNQPAKSYAYRIYIPLSLWKPPTALTGKRIKTHALLHEVAGATPYGRKDFKYQVASFPAFGRDKLFPQYTITNKE